MMTGPLGGDIRTLARFLRHSVQALGVTTPRPLLRFEFWASLAVSLDEEDEEAAGVG